MALDSKAAFQLRASEIGIGSDDITRMEDGGIASFSQFAFCCSYQPGGSSEEALFDHLESVLGTKPCFCSKLSKIVFRMPCNGAE